MTNDADLEIARLLEEHRRADEASAPAFREVLSRRRTRRAPSAGRIPRPALAAAALLVVVGAALLLRRPRVHETELIAAASALAAWKSPTDVLLQTPGSELLSRTPVFLSRVPELDGNPLSETKGVPR